MNPSADQLDSAYLEVVVEMIGAACSHLPKQAYSLQVESIPDSDDPGVRVTLRSEVNAKSASEMDVLVFQSEGVVYAFMGEDTRFEIPEEKGWRPTRLSSFRDEIDALARAVVGGGVQETLWLNDEGMVWRSKANVRIDERTVKSSTTHIGVRPKKLRKIERQYEPYLPGSF